MSHDEVVIHCPVCRKSFTAAEYKPGNRYFCPRCKGPLEVKPPVAFQDEPEPVPREIPVRLGRYVIESEIGRGGMGVIYKGRQEGLDRVVAIKLLLGGIASDDEMVRRFHREARAAAKLRHPNIVAIHEVGDSEGRPFFTMDYIPGKALDAILRESPMVPDRGARILSSVARAVHFAHERGIIHRDLKPANIIIDPEGAPHVTDFGLAKDMGSKSMLSITGEVMGTPAFMSPEQAEGRVHELGRKSDVYSLGAVLYRILTGRPPFEGPTVAATLFKVVNEYTVDPARLDRRVPPELSAICMKALEKDPKDRYATADAFADDLDRYLSGDPVRARPLAPWKRLRRTAKRHRAAFVAGGSVAVAALAVILLFAGKSELDLIEENLVGRPEMRLVATKSLLEGLDGFDDRDRALALARDAVMKGTDEASRDLAYAKPRPELAEAYAAHLKIVEPERLRARVIQILAQLKHRDAVPGVLGILRKSKGTTRVEAIRFFQEVPDARAFYELGRLASDRECGAEARQAIRQQYAGNVVRLFNPAAGRAEGALADLGQAVDDYNRRLEAVLDEGSPRGPKDAVEAAIAQLRAQDPERRVKAAWELGESKDARAREPLLGALEDADDGVSRTAAAALDHLGAAESKDKLLALLKAPRPGVRRNAAYLLGKAGDPSARPAIEAAHRAETDAEAKYAMEDALVVLR